MHCSRVHGTRNTGLIADIYLNVFILTTLKYRKWKCLEERVPFSDSHKGLEWPGHDPGPPGSRLGTCHLELCSQVNMHLDLAFAPEGKEGIAVAQLPVCEGDGRLMKVSTFAEAEFSGIQSHFNVTSSPLSSALRVSGCDSSSWDFVFPLSAGHRSPTSLGEVMFAQI